MLRTAQDSVHLVAATIGFVSYAALWAGVLWGSVLRSGWATSRLRHQTVHGIHMHVILLGLTLGVVHGLVQAAAPYGKVRAIDVVVPFGDRADPVGIGLGVLAMELMIATALSVLVQRKLGYARWRALHSLGYLSFTMVAAHLLISGTEVYRAPLRAAIAGSWAVVLVGGILTVAPVARMPRAVLNRLSPRHRAEEVTVSVDPGKCGSFGFCEQEAPGIFTLRSDQRLAYRSVVGSDQAEPAMRAAVVCPARAIKLGRLPATVVVSQPAADTSTVSPLATTLTPHTGSQPRAADPHAGALARMAAAADPHTGPQPTVADPHAGTPARMAAAADLHTGTPARMAAAADSHTGPQPTVADPHAGTLARMAAVPDPHTGPQPRAADPHAGAPARMAAAADPHTGSQPAAVSRHTGPQPGLRPVGANGHTRPAGPPVNGHSGSWPAAAPHTGPLPPVGAAPANGHTGPQPALRAVTGPPAGSPRPGFRSAGRQAGDPVPDEPLPAPDQLQDTGRHHLPRLRGIAGGRS